MPDPEQLNPHAPRHFPFAYRRWALLVIAALFFLALYGVDHRLKSSEIVGFVPEGASMVVVAEDFSGIWDALESVSLHQSILQEALRYPDDHLMNLRKRTGIRWTPTRWSAWFGSHLVVGQANDATGICIRPGILARVAIPLLAWFGPMEEDENLYRMGRVKLAWREGFLLASTSAEYVRSAAAQTAEVHTDSGGTDSIVLELREDPRYQLTFRVDDTLSLEGWVDIELADRQLPLTLAETWPDNPLLQIAGSSTREVVKVLGGLVPDFPGLELVKQAFQELEEELPRGWARGQDEFSLALMSIDTAEFLAVPEIALVSRGQFSPAPLTPARHAIRYEWAGQTGWVRPWLGEKMSICAVGDRDFRLFTTQERIMAHTLGRLLERPPVAADLVATLNLVRTTEVASILARRAAEHELLGHQNADDVDAQLIPLLQAVGALGVLRLEGQSGVGGMTIRATLDPVEAPYQTLEGGP